MNLKKTAKTLIYLFFWVKKLNASGTAGLGGRDSSKKSVINIIRNGGN